MFIQMADKQKRGISVVKTALLAANINSRAVCVQVSSWVSQYGNRNDYTVFVAAEEGKNEEPFYETGKTLVEAVRKAVASIKGRAGDAKTEFSEIAPF